MIPARFAPLVFGFVLSGLMSLLVSGVATWHNLGPAEGALGAWMAAWRASWAIGFPVVLVVGPLARRIVGLLVRAEP